MTDNLFILRSKTLSKLLALTLTTITPTLILGQSNDQVAEMINSTIEVPHLKVGDKILTNGEVNAARGVFDEAARMKDISQITDKINLLNASEILRKAHEAEEVINIKDLSGVVQSGVEVVTSTLEKYDAGNKEAGKDFLRWVKLGKNLQVQATGI